MIKIFQLFIAKMKTAFGRMARATRNDSTEEDLHNDAFVMALEIGDRRGKPIDFSDPADQDLVMRALFVEKVRRGDWKMRRAVRIDQEPESEDDEYKWLERLPAQPSSDPLVYLMAKESAIEADAMLANSYSQATAYAVIFGNFKNDRQKVCTHLVISASALARRVSCAVSSVKKQPSVFDRIERVPANFMPLRGRPCAEAIADRREFQQLEWIF